MAHFLSTCIVAGLELGTELGIELGLDAGFIGRFSSEAVRSKNSFIVWSSSSTAAVEW